MHRDGHVGTNLILFSPFAFALAWLGLVTPLAWALLGVVLLSTLPDVDLHLPGVPHRGPTHTVFFVGLVAAILAGAGVLVASAGLATSAGLASASADLAVSRRVVGAAFGFGVGALAVGGHLVGDAFTPMGVAPWDPVSERRHSLDWFDADSDVANRLWLAMGVVLLFLGVLIGSLLRAGVIAVRPSAI